MSIIFLLLNLSGCGDCGEGSEAAEFARTLSGDRLEKLFATIVSFDEDEIANFGKSDLHKITEFSDLNLKGLNYYPKNTSVLYLETCGLDDKVVLFVDTVKRRIELRAGEMGKREILWPRSK